MEKAKEVLESNITFNADLQSTEEIIEAMKEYANEALKEQREIIFLRMYNTKPPKGMHSVGIKPYFQQLTQKEFRDDCMATLIDIGGYIFWTIFVLSILIKWRLKWIK